MLRHFRSRAFALLTIPTLISSCHAYVPVGSTPVPGVRVAVELTDLGTVEMARWVGPGVGVLEGRVERSTDSLLTLSLIVVRQRNGIESFWAGEQVGVPRTLVARVGERRISRPRSAIAASMFTLAVAAIAVGFAIGRSGSDGGPSSGGGGTR